MLIMRTIILTRQTGFLMWVNNLILENINRIGG